MFKAHTQPTLQLQVLHCWIAATQCCHKICTTRLPLMLLLLPLLPMLLPAGQQDAVCEQGAAVLCCEGTGGLSAGHQQGNLHTPYRSHPRAGS
jgi:hypothetical protein